MTACTFFPDRFAKGFTPGVFTADLLLAPPKAKTKDRLPFLKLATFSGEKTAKNCYRHDAGVTSVTGCELDYDEGPMTVEQAAAKFEQNGIEAHLYETSSSTKKEPRWRALLPFSEPFTGSVDEMRAYRKGAVRAAVKVLGEPVSNESYTLSQSYYYGQAGSKPWNYIKTPGAPIDSVCGVEAITAPETPKANGQDTGSLDIAAAVEAIITGSEFHTSTARLAARFAALGHARGDILETLRGFMNSSASIDGSRWDERYKDLERVVDSALAKYGKKGPANAPQYAFAADPALLKFEPGLEPEPPEFIIEKLLPVGAGGVVGTGGSKKSTFMLWLMLHVTAGLPVFGYPVKRPGACLFITAEDERDLVMYRVYYMQRALLSGMALGDRVSVQEAWDKGLYVEDVSGVLGARLVDSNRDGMFETPHVDDIIKAYSTKSLSLVTADPTIYFGPGESFVNDGMAALMAVGKKVAKALDCAVVFVHHVSQDVSRNEIIDAHSGRSGTAFGDNGRFMYVLVGHKPPEKGKKPKVKTYRLPTEFMDMGLKTPTRIHQVKLSFDAQLTEPLWFDRHPDNPWDMVTAQSVKLTPTDEEARRKDRDAAHLFAFMEWFPVMYPDGASRSRLDSSYADLQLGEASATRQQARYLFDMALRDNLLVMNETGRYPFAELYEQAEARKKAEDIKEAKAFKKAEAEAFKAAEVEVEVEVVPVLASLEENLEAFVPWVKGHFPDGASKATVCDIASDLTIDGKPMTKSKARELYTHAVNRKLIDPAKKKEAPRRGGAKKTKKKA